MCVGEFCHRSNVACRNLSGRLLRFAARRYQLPDALIGFRLHIVDMRIRLECSSVDAEGRDRPDLCCRSFEDEHRQVIAKLFRVFWYCLGCIR